VKARFPALIDSRVLKNFCFQAVQTGPDARRARKSILRFRSGQAGGVFTDTL
jgi:hypothetical protein